jgi:hypothetical protein
MHFAGLKLENGVIVDPCSNEEYKIIMPPHLPREGYVLTDDTHAAITAYPYVYIFRYIDGTYYYIDEIFLVADLPRKLCIHHTSIAVNGANHVISLCAGDCESDEHSLFIQINGEIAAVMHTFAVKYVFTTLAAVFIVYETYIETHDIAKHVVKKYDFNFHQFKKIYFVDDRTLKYEYISGDLNCVKI